MKCNVKILLLAITVSAMFFAGCGAKDDPKTASKNQSANVKKCLPWLPREKEKMGIARRRKSCTGRGSSTLQKGL